MPETNEEQSPPRPANRVFTRAALSMLLLWSAFPPAGLAAIGWVALLPIIHLINDPHNLRLRDYGKIWAVGCLYWLVTFYFIPIPHPALWLGWIAISIYLACYLPFFVVASRTMIQKYRVPLVVAVPVAWVGLELIRSHLLTGMGLVNLSHTQYRYPLLIQISDLGGAYTLSFAMACFAAALSHWISRVRQPNHNAWQYLLLAATILLAVSGYGLWQLRREVQSSGDPLVVALIQGSINTVLTADPELAQEMQQRKTEQYQQLTRDALSRWDDIELVIWPENGWPYPDLLPETDLNQLPLEDQRAYEQATRFTWQQLQVRPDSPPFFLVGAVSVDPIRQIVYGSALLIDRRGQVQDRYFKNHLVMFGEYVPLSSWIPLLQKVPAIGKGLNAGSDAMAMEVDGKRIAPSICFETTVPHYIRRQVSRLTAQDEEPDVLVNVTNDGWFYGTSCLDFHLACNVCRAVEMRKPLLVCANTGFSAAIDSAGQILAEGPRRNTDTLRTEVQPVRRFSLYRLLGDALVWPMAVVTIAAGLVGFWSRPSSKQQD